MSRVDCAIKICGLRHAFKDKVVLDNINFEIGKGTIFGLLGPSGAGKTTLINILTGQLNATAGNSMVFGTESSKLTGEQYAKLGMVMDNSGLYERMSCYDNLRFYQKLDGKTTEDIEDILQGVGLLTAKKTPVMNLSKGMKNRLAFARAVLRCPEILFLDEPTSGLDPSTVEEIHKLILAEKEKGTTIFLTTHNMHEAEKLCDTIALLNEGSIVEYGAPTEICRRYNHQKKILVHLKNGGDIVLEHSKACAQKLKELFAADEVETIHSTEPNLETIFMELTGRKLEV